MTNADYVRIAVMMLAGFTVVITVAVLALYISQHGVRPSRRFKHVLLLGTSYLAVIGYVVADILSRIGIEHLSWWRTPVAGVAFVFGLSGLFALYVVERSLAASRRPKRPQR